MTSQSQRPVSALPVAGQLAEAGAMMASQIGRIMSEPGGPFRQDSPAGFQRGIDFYPARRLIQVAAQGAHLYRQAHGVFPQLTNPAKITEKIFWSKIFRPMKIPEAGNKLKTAELLSDDARAMITVPNIVWRSGTAKLPATETIEPGTYYLKTNHGSGMFRRIEWPVSDLDRHHLEQEFAINLKTNFGYWHGEWWYVGFKREVFLERSISSDPFPIAWGCYTFDERVGPIAVYRKVAGGDECTYVTADFNPLDWQDPSSPRIASDLPSGPLRKKIVEAASAIGRGFSFVRVDLILGDEGKLYLSELTFAPNNALTAWPTELDLEFGARWKLDPMMPQHW